MAGVLSGTASSPGLFLALQVQVTPYWGSTSESLQRTQAPADFMFLVCCCCFVQPESISLLWIELNEQAYRVQSAPGWGGGSKPGHLTHRWNLLRPSKEWFLLCFLSQNISLGILGNRQTFLGHWKRQEWTLISSRRVENNFSPGLPQRLPCPALPVVGLVSQQPVQRMYQNFRHAPGDSCTGEAAQTDVSQPVVVMDFVFRIWR